MISKLNSKELMPCPELIDRMKDMVETIYVVLYKSEFMYKDANPTDSCYIFSENYQNTFKRREELIYSAMTQHSIIGR